MTPEQRSAEMSRRRKKGIARRAGGRHDAPCLPPLNHVAEHARLRAAIQEARQLLADIANHEVNPEDEAEKWLRAFGWPATQEGRGHE